MTESSLLQFEFILLVIILGFFYFAGKSFLKIMKIGRIQSEIEMIEAVREKAYPRLRKIFKGLAEHNITERKLGQRFSTIILKAIKSQQGYIRELKVEPQHIHNRAWRKKVNRAENFLELMQDLLPDVVNPGISVPPKIIYLRLPR